MNAKSSHSYPCRLLVGLGLILGATALAYWPALAAGFIWNDSDYVTAPELRSLHGLGRIWFEVGATQQYYPVLHSAFWLEHRLWGDSALGYHAVNILLHGLGAGLFAILLWRLMDKVLPALLGGLIFALHPVCVESVAWITEQKNTLSTVFYLLAALMYLEFDDRRSRPPRAWYFLACAFFGLAILSKSMAATLPGALLVVAWWRRGRLSWRHDGLPLLPWIFLGAGAGLFTGWVERAYIGAEGSAFGLAPIDRLWLAGRAVWFYLGKTFLPANLIFIYPRWTLAPGGTLAALPAVGVGALLLACWACRRRTRALLAGLLLFIGGLFPVLGFFNVYAFIFSYVADHWQYLALFGIIAISAGGWDRLVRKSGRLGVGMLHLLAVAVVAALGALTWRDCHDYRSPDAFYRIIISRNPDAWMPHNNLGLSLFHSGRMAEAADEFAATLRIRPDFADGHFNLGKTYYSLGRYSAAREQFEAALRLRPTDGVAAHFLGRSLAALNLWPEAIQAYELALRLGTRLPQVYWDLAVAHYNYGLVLGNQGRFSPARNEFQKTVEILPDYPEGHENLGRALVALGFPAQAHREFQTAARLRAAKTSP